MIRIICAVFIVFLAAVPAFGATRTIANGGGNWSSTSTWVEGAAATAADDVVVTGTSGAVTIDTTSCAAKTINLTGYTSALTFGTGNNLTVSTTVTLGGTLTGTGNLTVGTAATITSNGLTIPGGLLQSANSTITLSGPAVVAGAVSISGTGTTTITGNNLTCAYLYITTAGAKTIAVQAGKTVTVTTGISLGYFSGATTAAQAIQSGTASSTAYLVYQGTQANLKLVGVTFTDIDASGGNTIYNYQGGTLTRTANIADVVLPPAACPACPASGNSRSWKWGF